MNAYFAAMRLYSGNIKAGCEKLKAHFAAMETCCAALSAYFAEIKTGWPVLDFVF
jgi:hypothetical protein